MPLELSASEEELVRKFRSLRTARDVSGMLEVNHSTLIYHLYRSPLDSRYASFPIAKRGGGQRTICAPMSAIKILQRKLNYILQRVYVPKGCVHGFVQGHSVLTNAQTHARRSALLNVDLQDFFPTINFGRVRGMFMGRPYNVPAKAATVLAQICCFDGALPQGAPTSPVVSNMICGKLDSEMLRLARRFRCTYTRYADDITISTTRRHLPPAIATLIYDDEATDAEVGEAVRSIIESNGFQINHSKVRIQERGTRKEVTGLVVNEAPNVKRRYVRELRAITHAIDRFGPQRAEQVFHERYDRGTRKPGREPPSLTTVVQGKFAYLRMVKGESDPVYRRMYNRYQQALGRPIVYVTDPLRDLAPSLWILESESTSCQGSAFNLAGVGLVTCNHVLAPDTKAFQHHDFTTKRPVEVVASLPDLDLAVLRAPDGEHSSLDWTDPALVCQGRRLTLAGFPNYRFGDTPYITEGCVAGLRTISTLRWLLLSTPIISGNSGGPVLDLQGRVVGVAATGAEKMERARDTEHHGVIPITALTCVLRKALPTRPSTRTE